MKALVAKNKDIVKNGFPLLTELNDMNPDKLHKAWMKKNKPEAYARYMNKK